MATADGGERSTVAVLFSAGKDSALAACLLDPFHDARLCHCTFDVDAEPSVAGQQPSPTVAAERAATALDLPLTTVDLDESVAREAVERMVADGYPREGIQRVHEHALETVAGRDTVGGAPVEAVADGTRRDDRAPTVDRASAQSLEDRHGVDYLRPLAGYGRSAVDDLVERLLTVETGASEAIATADYESELRALMATEYGTETVGDVFPEHVQSRVTGRRE